jgi:hypothetical protein
VNRFRPLVAFPIAWAFAYLVLERQLFGTADYDLFHRVQVELVKVLSLVGFWAAALAFQRGEYLRRAWGLLGLCLALLLLRDLTLALPGLEAMGPRNLQALRSGLVVIANVAQVAGTWLLARAWKVADLSLPGPRWGQGAVLAGTALLAAAFVGPSLVADLRQVAGGDWTAVTPAASSLGDLVSVSLIAPLLLTALALRGGLFAWPWVLLTTSYVAWLLYDAVFALGPWLGLGEHGTRAASELFRGLGCTFGFSAGLAQRAIVRGMGKLLAPR